MNAEAEPLEEARQIRNSLGEYRGTGDCSGADLDEDDPYTHDLDHNCTLLAKRLEAGYRGDGDWMGANRDASIEDYEPDFLSGSSGCDAELFKALAVLERHLSSRSGGRNSGVANEGDDYSPDRVDAALAQLERAVARGRRYGMYGLYGLYGLSTTEADGDDDAGLPVVEPEMVAAVELIKRGLRRMVGPDSDDGGADVSAGLGAVALLKRKAKAALGRGRDDDSVEGELRRARQGVLVSRDSEDELMLAMKDLTTSAHQRRVKRMPGRGSHGVRAGYDDDQMLVEAMHGLLARRRPPKGKGAAAKEGDDDFEPLADVVGKLVAQHRAVNKSAVGQDPDDAALIGGVSDVLGRWQAKPRASEEELLAMLAELVDKDEPRRRRAEGCSAVRDEDDVLLIDSLSDLIHSQKYEPLAAEITRLVAQHRAKLKSKGSVAVGRDTDDAALIDGVSDVLGRWQAKPRASEEELLARLSEWIDTDEPRRRRAEGSAAVRDEDDVLLIDSLSGLIAHRRPRAAV
jgi:hypothetical protein